MREVAGQAQKRDEYSTGIRKEITVLGVKGLLMADGNRPRSASWVKIDDCCNTRPYGSMNPEMPVFAARANAYMVFHGAKDDHAEVLIGCRGWAEPRVVCHRDHEVGAVRRELPHEVGKITSCNKSRRRT